MHKKLGFLVMLVGLLALSLAFTGCAAEEPLFEGNPLPWYLLGDFDGPENTSITFTATTAQYNGAAPYRIDVDIDGDDTGGSGTIEYRLFAAPYDSIGEASFDYTPWGATIVFDEIDVESPYGVPLVGTYTKRTP